MTFTTGLKCTIYAINEVQSTTTESSFKTTDVGAKLMISVGLYVEESSEYLNEEYVFHSLQTLHCKN